MQHNRKRLWVSLLMVALAISLAAGTALAAGVHHRRNFMDRDNDGICDNLDTTRAGCNYTDADGDGVCDNLGSGVCAGSYTGTGLGFGRNCTFIDADGDGVCDNLGTHAGCGRWGGCRK